MRVRPIGMMHMVDEGRTTRRSSASTSTTPSTGTSSTTTSYLRTGSLELQRFFQDYKVLEGKEVDVGDFEGPEEAVDAVRHAMDLYEKHFARTG